MSTVAAIRAVLKRVPKGKPFTRTRFTECGSPAAVGRTLAHLAATGEIRRAARGVYVRPKFSRYVAGGMAIDVREVARTVARRHGETLQVHGFEAIRRFGFSTQLSLSPVYHTSGTTRTLHVGAAAVRLRHTSNRRLLQFPGEPAGDALSALWYLGKKEVTPETVARIAERLPPEDFAKLRTADMPAWMAAAFDASPTGPVHG